MMLVLSCSFVDIQYQSKATKSKPRKILIGAFENRIQGYSPLIIKDFKDSLRFEFLKLGYDAEVLPMDETKKTGGLSCDDKQIESFDAKESQKSEINPVAASKNAIQVCCEKYTSFIFITGSISLVETDELTDSKASVIIPVLIFNNSGEQIGEARYVSTGQVVDAEFIKKVSKGFAAKINSKIHTLRYK
jgi:hypothetical protein